MSLLEEKLYIALEHKYDYIRLSSVNINTWTNIAEWVFVYPEHCQSEVQDNRGEIERHIRSLTKSIFDTKIVLNVSELDCNILRAELPSFFVQYPAVSSVLQQEDIVVYKKQCTCDNSQQATDAESERQVLYSREVEKNGIQANACVDCARTVNIDIALTQPVLDYAKNAKLVKNLQKFLYRKYFDTFVVSLIPKRSTMVDLTQQRILVLDDESNARTILYTDAACVVGEVVNERAGYIVDNLVPRGNVVLCGTLVEWVQLTAKKTGRIFYKLRLEDYTGSINGVVFTTKRSEEALPTLVQGDSVVIKGSIERDEYSGGNAVQLMPRHISKCMIDKSFVYNRIKLQVPNRYSYVHPQPYKNMTQSSLLEITEVNQALLGKEYVVFDLETTGLVETQCTIIDIGAVKIREGTIVEVFETLIDPQTLIPDNIVGFTGISNDDVKGKPRLEQVLPDFFKFCHDAALVAHNMDFDYKFVRHHGKVHNIYFDNDRIDTMDLAKKYMRGLKNYKLSSICERLNIVNNQAHRALSDALACAKVFVALYKG